MIHRLGRRPALDGVRAGAIAAVMGLHAIAAVFPGGGIGVDVFFVLSAFLITSMIIEEAHDRDGKYGFRNFYWRRAYRLGPALLLWLAFVAAPTSVVIHQAGTIPLSTVASLFYVGDFVVAWTGWMGDAYTHVWSLAIEEQFYLLWPVFLVFVVMRWHSRARRRLLSLGLVVAVAVTVLGDRATAGSYFLPMGHVASIAAGCVSAELFAYGVPLMLAAWIRKQWVAWLLTGAIASYVVGLNRLQLAHQAWLPPILSVGVGGVLLHLVGAPQGALARFLSLRPLVWVGQRSYGLYLYHRTLAILLPGLFPGMTLRVVGPLTLIVALGVAAISFGLVERPLLRYGRSRLGPTRAV